MPTLILICGMAGAGKTTLAKQLERDRQGFRLCPDEWIRAVIKDESDKTELDRLREPVEQLQWKTARQLLLAGISVILENGFWSGEERKQYCSEARAISARVELYYLDVPKEELWRRIEVRNSGTLDHSFRVTREDLDLWWTWFTPPDGEEEGIYDAFWKV